uniref:Uncharacterized protein n=1 Tax=Cacopsylla melanoneura TaxID=428564 RepID=A0A8D9BB96_9HEMI
MTAKSVQRLFMDTCGAMKSRILQIVHIDRVLFLWHLIRVERSFNMQQIVIIIINVFVIFNILVIFTIWCRRLVTFNTRRYRIRQSNVIVKVRISRKQIGNIVQSHIIMCRYDTGTSQGQIRLIERVGKVILISSAWRAVAFVLT